MQQVANVNLMQQDSQNHAPNGQLSCRKTVSVYNVQGGMLLGGIWKNRPAMLVVPMASCLQLVNDLSQKMPQNLHMRVALAVDANQFNITALGQATSTLPCLKKIENYVNS